MKVEVIRAWPRRHEARMLFLPPFATVADAVAASGMWTADVAGYAVFGERVDETHRVREGDRVELLAALQADPKEARRRRAGLENKTRP